MSLQCVYVCTSPPASVAQLLLGRVSAPRSGSTGFDPGLRQTKVVNNGTSCSLLGTRIFGVGLGLVAPCQYNVTGGGIR